MVKRAVTILGLVLLAVLAGYILRDVDKAEANNSYRPQIYTPLYLSSSTPTKADAAAVLAFGMEKQAKLITGEVNMEYDLVLKNTWLDLDIFTKEQRLSFPGKAVYTVGLDDFSSENIVLDNESFEIYVSVKQPYLYSVYLDSENILVSDPKNGILRFGDITLTPEEMKGILMLAEEGMKEKALESQNVDAARESARGILTEIFSALLEGAGFLGYELQIVFE